jgi:hypothetical protein
VIAPTAVDILRTIEATIVEKIEPSLSDLSGRSASATIRHLLRHVIERLQHEGELLTEDIDALRGVLAKARDYFHSLGSEQGAGHAAAIESVLLPRRPAPTYATLEMLATEAGALRCCLYQALKQLQALRERQRQDPQYVALRGAIRAYLVTQIEHEERIIAPAFFGRGPRR